MLNPQSLNDSVKWISEQFIAKININIIKIRISLIKNILKYLIKLNN